MITLKQIKTAVNTALKKNTGIKVNSKDIKEGFERPSFFVELDDVERIGLESQVEYSLTVRIYYFPSSEEEASIEILEMQDTLFEIFDTHLVVDNRLLHIIDPGTSESDGVLQFTFNLSFEDGREVEDAELIQEIDFDVTKG